MPRHAATGNILRVSRCCNQPGTLLIDESRAPLPCCQVRVLFDTLLHVSPAPGKPIMGKVHEEESERAERRESSQQNKQEERQERRRRRRMRAHARKYLDLRNAYVPRSRARACRSRSTQKGETARKQGGRARSGTSGRSASACDGERSSITMMA